MDISTIGNIYLLTPSDDMDEYWTFMSKNGWENAKNTNREAVMNPFLGFYFNPEKPNPEEPEEGKLMTDLTFKELYEKVVVLSEKISMTENVKIFISHIIRNESKNNYMAFARELNAHVRTDFVIKLPSLKPGVPDCEFMDKYIENLKRDFSSVPDYFLNEGYDKAFWYLDNINQEDFERDYAGISVAKSIALSDRKWDYFTVEDIVSSVHNGKSYNASDLVVSDGEEYVSYVTRTDENNGVSMYVQALDYQGLEKANAITIGDTTATIFFQEHEFITGPHIIVIRADWLNVYTANFIITILNQEKYRYPVFGRAFTKDLIKQTKVYLPIDKDGNPDYRFMEDYIKSLPFSKKI
jgi:hypothetical protein